MTVIIDGSASADFATPLPVAEGGTGATSLALGKVVQVVNVQTGAVATGTTVMPYDDTIPQNTEGNEYMTLAITPTSATNKLKIEVVINASGSVPMWIVAGLFQDSTASAIAGTLRNDSNATELKPLTISYYMAAGTTSATTFKIRVGLDRSGTTTFNGISAGRELGGVYYSSITITEYSV